MKKINIANLIALLLFTTAQPSCSDLMEHNLIREVEKYSNEYIQKNSGYNYYNIPNKLMPEYNLKIQKTIEQIKRRLNLGYQKPFSQEEINQVIKQNLKKFAKTLKNIILKDELNYKIDPIITEVLQERSIDPHYISRYKIQKKTIDNIQINMKIDKRNYARKTEIKKEINKVIDTEINGKPKKHNWNLFSWITNIFDPNSSNASYKNYHYNDNEVQIWELESKVTQISYQMFLKQNIKLEELSNTAESEYKNKFQKVIHKLKSRISYTKNFVTTYEIETVIKEEMQSVLDKINFVDEKCVICQDKLNPNELAGITNCGHPYHYDCISTWLKTDIQKSCPLCRKKHIIIDSKIIPPKKYL